MHARSQDLQRVGAPRGGSRISGWGGTMEGRGAVGTKRRGRWNEKLVHLALGLFTLGVLFQNNLGC